MRRALARRGTCALVLALAIVVGGACVQLDAQSQPAPKLSEDEVGVYSALLREIYQAGKDRPIVISDQTALGVPPGMVANVPVSGPVTQKVLDRISMEARRDYEDRNHKSAHLASPCNFAPGCVAVDVADLAPQVKNEKAWRKFFQRYKGTPGIVVVSRIGFNRERTEAVAYTGYSCGTLCGQGEFVWLVKRAGAWGVEDRTVVWISQK